MKPPERYEPDDPREWMNRARSNLRRARDQTPGTYLEDLCFDAQQAAKKAIKAMLLGRGIDFPYVHDLAELTGIPGIDLPKWEKRIIEAKKGVVRRRPVSERAKRLFWEDGSAAMAKALEQPGGLLRDLFAAPR